VFHLGVGAGPRDQLVEGLGRLDGLGFADVLDERRDRDGGQHALDEEDDHDPHRDRGDREPLAAAVRLVGRQRDDPEDGTDERHEGQEEEERENERGDREA